MFGKILRAWVTAQNQFNASATWSLLTTHTKNVLNVVHISLLKRRRGQVSKY